MSQPRRNPPRNVHPPKKYGEDLTHQQEVSASVGYQEPQDEEGDEDVSVSQKGDDKGDEDVSVYQEGDDEGDEDVNFLDSVLVSVRNLGQFVRRHPLTAMSYASVPLLAFLSGILVTLYRIEPVDKGEIIRDLRGDLVANITRKATAQIRKELQMELHEAQLKCITSLNQTETFNKTYLQEVNAVETRLQNKTETFKKTYLQEVNAVETRLQNNVNRSTEALKQNLSQTLENWKADLGTSFQEKMQTLLEKESENLARVFKEDITQAETNVTKKMENAIDRVSDTFQEDLKEAKSDMGDVRSQTGRLKELVDKIDTAQSVAEQLMELRGFMKIDTFGPLLVGLAVGEVLIALCVWALFSRGVTGQVGSRDQQGQRPRQEGDSSETGERGRAPRPPRLIDTHNRVVLGLCFRGADEQLTRTLSDQLVNGCTGQKPTLRTFFINSMEDIQDIPACRAALVFVAPDEREMIIEDERYHIGRGLRRHAVQCLVDSGVEVFIVIFNDKKSVTLPSNHLYNSKLGQVNEHPQLIKLKKRERVFSIRDKFHDHQYAALLQIFNTIFT